MLQCLLKDDIKFGFSVASLLVHFVADIGIYSSLCLLPIYSIYCFAILLHNYKLSWVDHWLQIVAFVDTFCLLLSVTIALLLLLYLLLLVVTVLLGLLIYIVVSFVVQTVTQLGGIP